MQSLLNLAKMVKYIAVLRYNENFGDEELNTQVQLKYYASEVLFCLLMHFLVYNLVPRFFVP